MDNNQVIENSRSYLNPQINFLNFKKNEKSKIIFKTKSKMILDEPLNNVLINRNENNS